MVHKTVSEESLEQMVFIFFFYEIYFKALQPDEKLSHIFIVGEYIRNISVNYDIQKKASRQKNSRIR